MISPALLTEAVALNKDCQGLALVPVPELSFPLGLI
jgi:hypothetical protein